MYYFFINTIWALFIVWLVILIIINVREVISFRKLKEIYKCTRKELKYAKQSYELVYTDIISYTHIIENEWLLDIILDIIIKGRIK